MAKSKRLRKKLEKQQQKQVLFDAGLSKKQVNKLNSKQLEKLSKPIITKKQEEKKQEQYIKFWQDNKKEQQKILKRRQAKDLHRWKVYELEKLGADRQFLSEYVTRKISKSDIENGLVNRYTHPDIFPQTRLKEEQTKFDFDKVYKIITGKVFYFAYLDYTGEFDLEYLIRRNNKRTDKELLQLVTNLLLTAPSYVRGKSLSSGKAGTYRYRYTDPNIIKVFHAETKEITRGKYLSRDKRSRIHPANRIKGYQELINRDKKTNYFDEFTFHSILVIMYTFMDNITEHEREVFYQDFYEDLSESIKEVYDILPFPWIREGYY